MLARNKSFLEVTLAAWVLTFVATAAPAQPRVGPQAQRRSVPAKGSLRIRIGIVTVGTREVRPIARTDVKIFSPIYFEKETALVEQYEEKVAAARERRQGGLREGIHQKLQQLDRAREYKELELVRRLGTVSFDPARALTSGIPTNTKSTGSRRQQYSRRLHR